MLRVDAISTGRQLNRYITYSTFVKLDDNDPKNKKIAYQRKGYHVEWVNVKSDVRLLFKRPIFILPRIAYSLAAFWFIFQGKHQEAMMIAFSGALAVDATSGAASTGSVTQVSVSHTCSGSNRVLISGVEMINTTTSWTYAGAAITEDITDTSDMVHKMGHKIAPSTGSNTLEASLGSAEAGNGIFGISFTGADQTTQPDASGTTASGTSTTPSITFNTVTDGAYAVDNLLSRAATLTVDASQTQIVSQTIDSITSRRQGGSYELKATAGSITMSWSLSASVLWVLESLAVRPAAITDLSVSVNDAITVAENITVRLTSFINVNDSITVTENVNVEQVLSLSVSDSISVAESVTMLLQSFINVNDAISVAEAVTLLIPFLVPSVFDAITVAENVNTNLISFINVNDSITITESVTAFLPFLTVSVNDSITITEAITLLPQVLWTKRTAISSTWANRTAVTTTFTDRTAITTPWERRSEQPLGGDP